MLNGDTPQTRGSAPAPPPRGVEHRCRSYRRGPATPPSSSESLRGSARAAPRRRSSPRATGRSPPPLPPREEAAFPSAWRNAGGDRADSPLSGETRPLTRGASSDDLVRGFLQKAAGFPSHPHPAAGGGRVGRAAAEPGPAPGWAGGEEPGEAGAAVICGGGGGTRQGRAGRGRSGL